MTNTTTIYYECGKCHCRWLGPLVCPECENRAVKGVGKIDGGTDPGNPVEAAVLATYDALCICDDEYGDNAWCPVCSTGGTPEL